MWVRSYLLKREGVEIDSLLGAIEDFEPGGDEPWVLWPTVVYFVFSGVYIIVGYIVVFIVVNSG